MMPVRLIYVVMVAVFAMACEPSLSSFDADVNALIRSRCTFETDCQLRIRDATKFDWDEMYVLREGVLDVEARKYLPEVGELRGEFNRKIVFLKNGKRVGADEAPSIIEGEHTPPGMLFFDEGLDGNPDCLRYLSDVEFTVTTEKWIRGNVYKLECANCPQSPVFAEFGVATPNSQTKP